MVSGFLCGYEIAQMVVKVTLALVSGALFKVKMG